MADFKVGDVVKMKSGGPAMTVDHVGHRYSPGDGLEEALCSWFEQGKGGQQVRKQDWFTLTSLTRYDENQESAFYPGRSIME